MTVFELVFYLLVELALGAMMGVINMIFVIFAIVLFYFGDVYLTSPTSAIGVDNAATGAIFITFGVCISLMIVLSSTATVGGMGYFTFLVIDGFIQNNSGELTGQESLKKIKLSNDFGTLMLEILMAIAILPYIAIGSQFVFFLASLGLMFYAVFASMVSVLWLIDWVIAMADPDASLLFTKVYYTKMVEVPDPPATQEVIRLNDGG